MRGNARTLCDVMISVSEEGKGGRYVRRAAVVTMSACLVSICFREQLEHGWSEVCCSSDSSVFNFVRFMVQFSGTS